MRNMRNKYWMTGWCVMLVALLLTGCRTHHGLTTDDTNLSDKTFKQRDFMQLVSKKAQLTPYVTAKLKFTASLGGQDVSVGGSLKMKRDDVIRIQLVALGIMEAGRLEFTQDSVLILDRINKQYVKAAYDDLDFMKANGINFYSLQALFWNELFQPGKHYPVLSKFSAVPENDEVSILFDQGQMSYRWQAERKTGRITSTHVMHESQGQTDAQMDWMYKNFKPLDKRQFPTDMQMKVKANGNNLAIGLQLSSLATDGGWETRTSISSKMKRVDAEDIFYKLMSL